MKTVLRLSRKLWSAQKEKGRKKGYAEWNPQKKTKVVLAQIQEILREYNEQLPLTGRQIFYRLVGAYGHPKTESFANSVSEILVRARRARIIPFDHIRDDGASVMEHTHYVDENDFYKHVNDEGNNYKRDKLQRQKKDIRVYCEAAGMMPQLRTVCEPFSVKVYSCSGFDSLTAKYDLASDIVAAWTYRGRDTVILHLGDHDPSGETIFDAISEDVYAFLEVDIPHKDPTEIAIFERVAPTTEQIRRYQEESGKELPSDPAKESSHAAGWGSRRAYQLEALPPSMLASELKQAIEKHFDMEILEEDIRAEEEERRRITKALPAPKS